MYYGRAIEYSPRQSGHCKGHHEVRLRILAKADTIGGNKRTPALILFGTVLGAHCGLQGLNPLAYRVSQSYNAVSQPVGTQDPRGNFVTQLYNNRGMFSGIMNELSYQTTQVYDGVGNMLALTRFSGDLVTNTFDALNRVVTTTFSLDNKNVSYVYDPVGNRTAVSDQSGMSTYAYDSVDRLVGRTDAGSLVQVYRYDLASQRVGLTDPDGGIRTITFDLDGRLTVFQDPQALLTTFQFDNAGRKISVRFGDGLRIGYGYDAADQILSIISDNGGTTQYSRFTFAYDGIGNRTVVGDLNGAWTTYSYDGKNRLTEDKTSGTNVHDYTYSYDGNDNRLTSSETGVVTQWLFDAANRIVTAVASSLTTTYSYSRNGNLTNVLEGGGNAYTMVYDNMNRLNYQLAGSSRYTYVYDADSLKRYEILPTGTTTIIWDGTEYLQGRS